MKKKTQNSNNQKLINDDSGNKPTTKKRTSSIAPEKLKGQNINDEINNLKKPKLSLTDYKILKGSSLDPNINQNDKSNITNSSNKYDLSLNSIEDSDTKYSPLPIKLNDNSKLTINNVKIGQVRYCYFIYNCSILLNNSFSHLYTD